jgi:putative membrane protein
LIPRLVRRPFLLLDNEHKPNPPNTVLPKVNSDVPLKPARNPPKTSLYDLLPLLRLFKPLVGLFKKQISPVNEGGRRTVLGHKKYLAHVESNVPLEITLFLSSYLAWLLKKGLLTPAIATAITNNIGTLQECSVNLQRIRNTPLPFAYQAHLRMSLWLYLLFLPVCGDHRFYSFERTNIALQFQIYTGLKYITIP